jgi:pilus assembly protein FimV
MGAHSTIEKPHWRATALAFAAAARFGISASDASARGLGRITVQSALGEPLRAEIDVPEINADELATLRTTIASPEQFRARGIEYNTALSGATLSLQRRADGRYYLQLTSTRAVNDPFLDLLLETSWSSGRIVRDYTMLFDPPSLRTPQAPLQAQTSPPAPSASRTPPAAPAPTARAPSPAPAARAPEAARSPVPSAAPAVAGRSAPAGEGKQVTVQAGDTAGKLAAANKPANVSLDQMLVAMLRSNPDAFVGGNVNRLRAGAVIDMPSADQVAGVTSDEAKQTLVAQSRDFNEFRRRLAEGLPTSNVPSSERQSSGKVQAQVQEKRPGAASPDKLTLSKGSVQGKGGAADQIARERSAREAAARVAELNKNISDLNRINAASGPAGAKGAASGATSGVAVPVGAAASAGRPSSPASTPAAATTATTAAATSTSRAASAAPAAAAAAASAAKPASAPPAAAVAAAASAGKSASASKAASAPAASTTAAASAPAAVSNTAVSPASAPMTATAAAASPASSPSASASTPTATSASTGASALVAAAAPASAPASKPAAAAAKPPVPAKAAETSFIDDLLENPIVPAAVGGILAFLLGFGFYRMQQRKKSTQVDSSFLESRLQPDSFFGASGGQRIDTNEGSPTGSSMVYSPSQLDAAGDVDPVAEADVYLAYGRDLQAEEILKEALRTNPNRVAVHSKLLEIYAKRRDTKAFELVATEAYGITQGQGPEWEHICQLGQELDPANALYRPGGAPAEGAIAAAAAATAAGAAFGATTSTTPQALAAGDAEKTQAVQASPPPDLDLDLDFSLDDPGTPAPPPSAAAPQPTLAHATPQASADEPMPALDMDFSSAPTVAMAAAPAAATQSADLDLPLDESEDDNGLNFDITAPEPVAAAAPTAQAAPAPADAGGMIEFDLGALSLDLPSSSTSIAAKPAAEQSMPSLSLPTAEDDAPHSTGSAPLSTAGFEDSGSDPLATKFALAQEFNAIGDPDGARSLAQEVVAEASGDLKSRAQKFLAEIS